MTENWETHWKDYYKILQVHPTAEPEVIEAAYSRLARKYHPDVNKTTTATTRMQEINEAHEILGNLEKRRKYHPEWLKKAGFKAEPQEEPSGEKEETSFSLTDFLTEHNISFKDKRHHGGALWVIEGEGTRSVIKELTAKGFSFAYSTNGGRASGNKSAWYTTAKG
jgi:curved DNA-binding protein CbpA